MANVSESSLPKILLLNGPNLNMLGIREPGIYGHDTLANIESEVMEAGRAAGVDVDCFQSNWEGALIDKIHESYGNVVGLIYNPGAHTHYSYALRDAVASVDIPMVEVHISDVDAREPFRAISVFDGIAVKKIAGHGRAGYVEALDYLVQNYC
jgi:3-dehydroquinate dehydratase-2